MIAWKKNCKLCLLIKQDKKLMQRIYDSSYYIPHSKDTLAQIHRDCNQLQPKCFSYLALTNHCKKHQHINAADYDRKMMQIAAAKGEMRVWEDKFEAQNAQDAVINKGMELLQQGEMKVTANHLLKAAKDKQDAQAKKRDQQLQLAEMIAHFASGEGTPDSTKIHDKRIIEIEDYDPAIPLQ